MRHAFLVTLIVAGVPSLAAPPPRTGPVLAWEAVLTRYDLPGAAAIRRFAEYTPGIPAPIRSRAEGRTAGWGFDQPRLQVEISALVSDGSVVAPIEGHASHRDPTPCAHLPGSSDTPMQLHALGAPTRPRTERELAERAHQIALLDVAHDGQLHRFVELEAGESATLIELVGPSQSTGRGVARRQLRVQRGDAELRLTEEPTRSTLCWEQSPSDVRVEVPTRRPRLERRSPPSDDAPWDAPAAPSTWTDGGVEEDPMVEPTTAPSTTTLK